jgi:hypothetical protein
MKIINAEEFDGVLLVKKLFPTIYNKVGNENNLHIWFSRPN